MDNLYETLGVAEDATDDQIKQALRVKAKQLHPDKNPEGAEEFKKVQHAYEVLINPVRREQYNQTGEANQIPDEFREILSVIAEAVCESIAKLASSGKSVRSHDLAGVVKTLLRSHLQTNEQGLVKCKDRRKPLDEIVSRIKHKDPVVQELLRGIAQEPIRQNEAMIKKLEHLIYLHKQAIEKLADFHYEHFTSMFPENADITFHTYRQEVLYDFPK